MTTPHQALRELAELYIEYSPLLDALIEANESDVGEIIAKEQRLGERIWTLGKIAFGPAAGAKLHIFRPIQTYDIDSPIRVWLDQGSAFSTEHYRAVQGCAVRSNRLGTLLDGVEISTPPHAMKQAQEIWCEKIEDDGEPTARGEKAKRIKEIAAELGIKENTVKKAVLRMGTVPK